MASPYVNQSNAFRQPTLADTYVTLYVEALIAMGTPFTTPRTTADIVAYITTTYPLFALDATFTATQLERAVKLGVLARCGADWLLRRDLTRVNVANQKYVFGRCGPGGPLITTCADYGPRGDRRLNTIYSRACSGSASSGGKYVDPTEATFGACDPSGGCCAPLAPPPSPATGCCAP
jgi:hypothetical protein